MLPAPSCPITGSGLITGAESCRVPQTHQARNTLPCISLVPSLPSEHQLRVYHFLESPAKTLPALKAAPETGNIHLWIGISLEEEFFFPKGARSEGPEVFLAALHSQENTAVLQERGASKPRECWQQPSRVLLPGRSKLFFFCSGSYSSWGG